MVILEELLGMNLETYEDLDTLLRMNIASSAVGTALELGLFWVVQSKGKTLKEIADHFHIPVPRCKAWLELLVNMTLIKKDGARYLNTRKCQKLVLATHIHTSWAYLAKVARLRYMLGNDLTNQITNQGPTWEIQPEDWFTNVQNDPVYASVFTRMLFERHFSVARVIAERLKTDGMTRILDLGGGSGVVSLALLEKNAELEAVVVDVENVCRAGRDIADGTPERNRIRYHPADLLKDPLPRNFDLALLCDVSIYEKKFLEKVKSCLTPSGEIVIIANIDQLGAWIHHKKANYALLHRINTLESTLMSSHNNRRTPADVEEILENAGFKGVETFTWDDGIIFVKGKAPSET